MAEETQTPNNNPPNQTLGENKPPKKPEKPDISLVQEGFDVEQTKKFNDIVKKKNE